MNTPAWTSNFPAAKIQDTKKKFYDRYVFCLEYSCPGGKIINEAKSASDMDVLEAINKRINRDAVTRQWRSSNNWYRTRLLTHDDVDQDQIFELVNLRFADNPRIRVRIEEPHVRIYCDSEEELYQLANEQFGRFRERLCSIYRPSSAGRLEQITDGCIVMKTDIGYRYKFIMRDGRYGMENKQALLKYLDQLGDLVKLSTMARRNLHGGDFMYRVWFYSNEFDIKTMVDLIVPGGVSKIHTIVCDN